MSQSLMVFRGGPLDGSTQEPEPGWPAPDVYMHRDWVGKYQRVETVADDATGGARHLYNYSLTASRIVRVPC